MFEATWDRIEQIVRMTDFSNLEALARVLDKVWIMKKIEARLAKISEEEELDNSSFFEWNDWELLSPKLMIAGREISLDKLRYNL